MLQIGVTVYCLALWAGIALGSSMPDLLTMPDPLTGILALAIMSAILLIPLAPRVMSLLLKSLDLAPQAPPARRHVVPPRLCAIPGAPGTPGAAQARAPSIV